MNDIELLDEEFIQMQLTYLDESIDKIADFVDVLLDKSREDIDGFDVNDTFRLVHGLKGTAGTYGFKPVSDVAATLENLLSLIREKKFILTIDALSFIIDSLELIVEIFSTIKANYKKTKQLSYQNINCAEKFKDIIVNYPVIVKTLFKSEGSKAVPFKVKTAARNDERTRETGVRKRAVIAYNARFTKNIIAKFLESQNYEVFETKSALEALTHICNKGCDIVFTFQVLEKFNGRSLCAVLKLNDEFSGIDVVFLTSDKNFNQDQLMIKPDHLIIIDDNLEANLNKIIK
ncbi:MAG: Chemotaxis protein CheA [bacterium ADurb.Bin243]|nr:MAG: Chemotaxis protein CheA [bacterium ADurb.Bin243]HOD39189.1 Hpt domain-containing protein [Candidatus Wallbacteria bacterium]